MSAEPFTEGLAPRLLTDVSCNGTENSLLECQATMYTGDSCLTSGVSCQGEYVVVMVRGRKKEWGESRRVHELSSECMGA